MYCVKCIKNVRWAFGTTIVALKEGKVYKNIGLKDCNDLINNGYAEHYEENVKFENKMVKIEYSSDLPNTKVYDPSDDEDGDEVDLLEVEKTMQETYEDGKESVGRKQRNRGRPKKEVSARQVEAA